MIYNRIEEIKESLYNALKKDYCVEILNDNFDVFSISIYKLYKENSVEYYMNTDTFEIKISNDKYNIEEQRRLSRKVLHSIYNYIKDCRKLKADEKECKEQLKRIFEFFRILTAQVYDIKYSKRTQREMYILE